MQACADTLQDNAGNFRDDEGRAYGFSRRSGDFGGNRRIIQTFQDRIVMRGARAEAGADLTFQTQP